MNRNKDIKLFKTRRYYLPKEIIVNYNVIINEKNVYNQAIDSDIKLYEEVRKLTTGQVEDYTTWCFLDYDYIKNHYRLIAVDLSIQKELESKVIQETEFVRQFQNVDNNCNVIDANGTQSMFSLMILEKIKENRSKFSQVSKAVS